MHFRTIVDIPVSSERIDHSTQMMLIGSCFTENIGKRLLRSLFKADLNPFGILYNPFSVSSAIKRLLSATSFSEDELLFNNGLYHSLLHHGHFSSTEKEQCLQNITDRFEKGVENMRQADLLLITFGSAYVYQWKETGDIVGNCHKFPSDRFRRFRLSVDDVTAEWAELIPKLTALRPDMKLLFTVSPVRHWKDGAHENQLSKSVLHLAIDNLQQLFPQHVRYFPAYEVILDELRDYRFYEDDMMHPSSFAVEYLWQRFGDTFFSSDTRKIVEEWEPIRKALEHRPLYPDTQTYQKFLQDTMIKMENFRKKYPEVSCPTYMDSSKPERPCQ